MFAHDNILHGSIKQLFSEKIDILFCCILQGNVFSCCFILLRHTVLFSQPIIEVVYLLAIFAKNEQENLTPAERNALKKKIELLEDSI